LSAATTFPAPAARLARHGDRVSVLVAERWRTALVVDSSVFDLVLEPE
jgi:hypothetical protein